MSSCALQFVIKFFENIGKAPYLVFVTPNLIQGYNAYDANLPKRSPTDAFIGLEECAESRTREYLKTWIRNVIIGIIAIIIITIAIIIGIMSYVGNLPKTNEITFLCVFMVVVAIIAFYLCYTSTNANVQLIDISPCVANATTEISIYESQTQKAINAGLCAY